MMERARQAAAGAVLAATALGAAAAAAEPVDFAFGRMLPAEEGIGFRAALPQDVYESVTRSDLGDLRVFDDDDNPVPYAIHRPASTEEYTAWREVPVFTIPRKPPGQGDARIDVELDDGGAIVAVSGVGNVTGETASWLMDTGPSGPAPTQLRIAWSDDAGGEFIGRVRIDVSRDLDQWRTIVHDKTIARLSSGGGQDVVADLIDLPSTESDPRDRERYFRLTQLEGSRELEVTGARFRARSTVLPERSWKRLVGRPVDKGFEFETGGRFPVDRIRVATEAGDYILTADLFSRAREEDAWRSRGERRFYRTSVQGVELTSEPLALATGDRFWRVELESTEVAPVLWIGWLPDEVVFLSQGPRPHLVAYGQYGLTGDQWPLRQLLSRLGGSGAGDWTDLRPLAFGDPVTLGGSARLEPPPETVDWQTVVLWAVLVLGVIVVGTFAFRLLRS